MEREQRFQKKRKWYECREAVATALGKRELDPAKTLALSVRALHRCGVNCHPTLARMIMSHSDHPKASYTNTPDTDGNTLSAVDLVMSTCLPLPPHGVENIEGIRPLPPARSDDCHPQDPHVRG